jgi:beta-glucosidase
MMVNHPFPDGFVWGAATSSFQIEGASKVDGRGESIWDRFAAQPGRIKDGGQADPACDHYHLFREDISLMKELGLGAYRFSIAWPRILPGGTKQVNPSGLDFYERLVDGLLEAGIAPYVTLYHWDLPQVLEDAGGWPSRATAEAFVELTERVSQRLGDRVRHWMTHNEPWCTTVLGYQTGDHAPGRKNFQQSLAAIHHLLLSHGWAVEVLRRNSPGASVGTTHILSPIVPASDSEADRRAAAERDGLFNRWFLDPIFKGAYPRDQIEHLHRSKRIPKQDLWFIKPGDLEAIRAPIDFLGINYYSRHIIRSREILEAANAPRQVEPLGEKTDIGWEIYPQGLTDGLVALCRQYALPCIYITENGAAYNMGPDSEGRIADTPRVEFLRRHVEALQQAIERGVPVKGYFVWSLLDNFEWTHGYTQRFGIVWIDYATQQRIPKDSARFYQQVIRNNGC